MKIKNNFEIYKYIKYHLERIYYSLNYGCESSSKKETNKFINDFCKDFTIIYEIIEKDDFEGMSFDDSDIDLLLNSQDIGKMFLYNFINEVISFGRINDFEYLEEDCFGDSIVYDTQSISNTLEEYKKEMDLFFDKL